MRYVFMALIMLWAGIGTSAVALATPVPESEARSWVDRAGQRFIGALTSDNVAEKYQILDEMFEQDIDTNYIARFVIGKYWKILTEEQQATYLELFKRYALSLYKTYPLDFKTEGLDFSVLSVRDVGKNTQVLCRIMLPKAYATENLDSLTVEFSLTKNDRIQITDVKIGESSLLLTYRTRFLQMMKDNEEEVEWFLEDLEDLVRSNEKISADTLAKIP